MRDDICLRCTDPERPTRRYAVKNRTGEPYCDDCARSIGEVHSIKPKPPAGPVPQAPAATTAEAGATE